MAATNRSFVVLRASRHGFARPGTEKCDRGLGKGSDRVNTTHGIIGERVSLLRHASHARARNVPAPGGAA